MFLHIDFSLLHGKTHLPDTDRMRFFPVFPPDMCSNSRPQFTDPERFCDIVIPTRAKPGHYVFLFGFCREKQNRTIHFFADSAAQIKPVYARHHHI